MRRLTIIFGVGLGDMLAGLPAVYALQAQGHRVTADNPGRRTEGARWRDLLPTYEPLEDLPGSEVLDFVAPGGPRVPWCGRSDEYNLVDDVARQCGVEITTTPRAPWLRQPPAPEREPYVRLGMEGSARVKYLTPEQMAACAEIAPCVAVHWEPREVPPGVQNLTGQTTAAELIALVAHARAVVSCDTGTLHLAAAFGVPLVAVVSPQTLCAEALAADYRPALWLTARRTRTIEPETVAEALRLVLETEPAPIPAQQTGPAWWQSAEVQSRMATAAEHQRRIDAADKAHLR